MVKWLPEVFTCALGSCLLVSVGGEWHLVFSSSSAEVMLMVATRKEG